MELLAKTRPVFSLSSKGLGKCSTAVTISLFSNRTKHVDIPPYRVNLRQEKVNDECVEAMVSREVAEKR